MKLVLVHGINQQAKSSALIEKQWLNALRARAGGDSAWPKSKVSTIETPFYGDRLFALAETKQDLSAVAQGVEDPQDDFAEFAARTLTQMAIKAGAKEIFINLSQTEWICSAGLRVILQYHRQMKSNGKKLLVTRPSPAVEEILDMTGFKDTILEGGGSQAVR